MSTADFVTAERLSRALNCLLIERFSIQDKTLLEKLLTGLNDADGPLNTIPIEAHCKWFANVLDVCRQRQTAASINSSTNLYAFALKYLAVLVKSEERFVALTKTVTLQSMIEQINLKESSVFNSYMSLLLAFNTHKRGIEYVFHEGLWKNILNAIHGLIVPAKYIEIQSTQYIANLIYKSFEHGMAPLCETLLNDLFSNLNSTDSLIGNRQTKELFAYNIYVKTLILSLEKFIGTKYESDVCEKILYKYSLSGVLINIKKLLNLSPILLKNYMTLHLLYDFFTVWNYSDIECILKSIFSHMNTPKDVQSYKQINSLYTQAIKYVNISNTHLAVNTEFEKELILGQLIPLKKCTEWLKCSTSEKYKFDDCCIIESKHILNYCNVYDSMINEVAISSMLNILDSVPILKQDSLEYLVTFFSTLTDRLLNSDNWSDSYQDSTYYKFLEILTYVFICWTKILDYKSSSKNAVLSSSTVPLVHSHSQFFHKTSHNVTLLQNSFKLISTAMNKLNHNSLHADDLIAFDKLCDTLNNFLMDTRPEIRDSCLQCISSLTMVSKNDSELNLTKLILRKSLPISVLNALKHDNDPFVRSKALECLEKMVSVFDIWEGSLKESDLMTHCLNLMQYESEGIIRRQIVKLITALFTHNTLSDELSNEICTVMVHISIKDPLWEVKTFSYEFWNCVVQKCIKKYPEPNNIERLNNCLVTLSSTGCLHVLYIALKEEHDLVVQKRAICLTKELLVFINSSHDMTLNEFNLKSKSVDCSSSIDENLENFDGSNHKKSRKIDSVDRILNSITTANDCELLPSLKSGNSSNIYPNDVCLRQKTDAYISMNDFLNFTTTYDFDDCDAKTQWVISTRSGLDSMLDDIISQSQNCCIEGADLIDCH